MKSLSFSFSLFAIIALIPFFILDEKNVVEEAEAIAYFPAPLKQIRDGVNPSNVTCTEGFELVLKKSNGQPACLKPISVAKLIDRGWAIHVLPDYTTENNNSEIFSLGSYQIETGAVTYYEGVEGYLAKPSEEGQFPAVVMIHEWWD